MGMNDSVQVPCDMLQKYYSLSFSKRTKHIYIYILSTIHELVTREYIPTSLSQPPPRIMPNHPTFF